MTQDLYIKYKNALSKYDFDKSNSSFFDLYNNSKKYFGFWIPFRQFTSVVKNMGVASQVKRGNGGVKRGLVYNAKADKYLLKLFPVLDTCPNCKGKGIIEIDLTDTK